jgi:hypothetical protein
MLRRQNHHHALFFAGFVKLLHQRVGVGIDGEHGVAVHQLPLRRAPARPQAGNAQWLVIGTGNAGCLCPPTAPVGLKKGLCRDDAVLRVLPSITKTGFDRHRLAARVVGVPSYFGFG